MMRGGESGDHDPTGSDPARVRLSGTHIQSVEPTQHRQRVSHFMTGIADIGAAVIGTGFIGTVHVEALRRIGVQVRGVLGSTPERGAERAASLGVGRAYDLPRRPPRRPVGGRRPRHIPQRPPSPPGDGRPGGRAARGVREASGDVGGRIARAGRAGRQDRPGERRQLQHPLLPAQPARARGRRLRRPRRRAPRDRTVLPGLAAPRQRLELAAPAGARRGPARGR